VKLVIIEGEGKKETITKYLRKIDSDFTVFATKGHVRDLPTKSLAINVDNNFEPRYTIMDDKKDIVAKLLATAKKADQIYLATDPDREGEAISWHLEHILEIPASTPCRIVFNEISQKAVAAALKAPRAVSQSLVDAQQARRVLDRLVGYKLSPFLCKKIQSNLSAGRVQSVALRLVVDKERAIQAFKPEEYWTLQAILSKDKTKFKSALATYKGKNIKPKSKEEMDRVLQGIEGCSYTVGNVKKSVTKQHAPAPFITSTMQQDALNKLGMTLKQSQQTAQRLYEGVEVEGEGKVALVTYIRTDSTRVSSDAQSAARAYIGERFGAEYVPAKPNFYKSKADAQDAHEAIRPININLTPESLKGRIDKNCYRLYKLIYDRFLASQMSEAVYNTVNVQILANDYGFKTTGKTLVFPGFTAAYKHVVEDEKEDDVSENGNLPVLTPGDECKLCELKPEQKFTTPPKRYTEASLIKAMEEKGIGRPATYTSIITTLATRGYTEKEEKFLKPTELGCSVVDMLIRYFADIMDVRFTANMETKLDDIELGGSVWQNVVGEFYTDFIAKLMEASGDDYSLKTEPEKTDIVCDKCGAYMVIRESKYGKFLACSAYPKCKNTHNLDANGEIIQPAAPISTDEICPDCGGKLVLKKGRYGDFLGCENYPKCRFIKNKNESAKEETPVAEVCPECGAPLQKKHGRYGDFLGCTAYPKCRYIKNLSGIGHVAEDGGECPDCGGRLKRRRSFRGEFYGCDNFPNCSFTSQYPVSEKKCPKCGSYMTKQGKKTVCANAACGHEEA